MQALTGRRERHPGPLQPAAVRVGIAVVRVPRRQRRVAAAAGGVGNERRAAQAEGQRPLHRLVGGAAGQQPAQAAGHKGVADLPNRGFVGAAV